MLGQYVNIARVEPLGFVEIRLASVPLSLSPCDVGQRFRNPAAIGQELTRLLKVTHRRVVILQGGIMIFAIGQYCLAKIRLKTESGFGCLPCLFTQSNRWLQSERDVADRIHV